MPDKMPNTISQSMPAGLSEWMPDRKSDRLSNSEHMPDRMQTLSEIVLGNRCQTVCQNICHRMPDKLEIECRTMTDRTPEFVAAHMAKRMPKIISGCAKQNVIQSGHKVASILLFSVT